MDPRFLRNLAQQARNRLPAARTDFAKAQLQIWITEFDALAQTTERDAGAIELCSPDQVTMVPPRRSSEKIRVDTLPLGSSTSAARNSRY
jgi:hypothetical protein